MKIFKSRIDVNVSSAFLLLSESVICFSIFCLLYQILPLQVLKDAAKLQFLRRLLIPFDAFLSLLMLFYPFLSLLMLFSFVFVFPNKSFTICNQVISSLQSSHFLIVNKSFPSFKWLVSEKRKVLQKNLKGVGDTYFSSFFYALEPLPSNLDVSL